MPEPPPVEPCALAQEVAHEAARVVARHWWAEAQRIAEQVENPAARWELLVTALRQRGWPEREG